MQILSTWIYRHFCDVRQTDAPESGYLVSNTQDMAQILLSGLVNV